MTEQLALPAVVPARAHEPNVPVPPVTVKLTVPVGVIRFTVSVTVALHVMACPTTTVDGAHEIVVLVGSVVNGNTKRPSLPAWSLSAP